MADLNTLTPVIRSELLDAIKTLPTQREVRHCGSTFFVSPFDIYAPCPVCEQRIKVRSFSGNVEIEDLFDAVFAWMANPGGAESARQRIEAIRGDVDE
jgi:hypothetical protein